MNEHELMWLVIAFLIGHALAPLIINLWHWLLDLTGSVLR